MLIDFTTISLPQPASILHHHQNWLAHSGTLYLMIIPWCAGSQPSLWPSWGSIKQTNACWFSNVIWEQDISLNLVVLTDSKTLHLSMLSCSNVRTCWTDRCSPAFATYAQQGCCTAALLANVVLLAMNVSSAQNMHVPYCCASMYESLSQCAHDLAPPAQATCKKAHYQLDAWCHIQRSACVRTLLFCNTVRHDDACKHQW